MSAIRINKSFYKLEIFNDLTGIVIAVLIMTSLPILSHLPNAFATVDEEEFSLRTSQQVYVPGEILEIYGTVEPNQILVIRLYDPTGLAIRIENLVADENGSFRGNIFTWPAPSRNLAFGTYTIEALLNIDDAEPMRAEVTFAGGFDQGIDSSKIHILGVKLDAPTQVTVNSQFRIFVQVTFDGALVEAINDEAVAEILGTSHIHSGNSTVLLNDKFRELHPGLYYADVTLGSEDSYVIHAAAFYRGFLSHDTRLITTSASSIGTIQDSVNQLNIGIEATKEELGRLQQGLQDTRSALNDTKITVTESTDAISEQIDLAQQASSQINAFILPVLALISVIIALQISLFARIRASYR